MRVINLCGVCGSSLPPGFKPLTNYQDPEVERLRSQLRAIELAVDGLNTKAFKQKPETQAVLDRIKATAREALK